MKKLLFIFCVFAIPIIRGCGSDNDEQKPEERIIGKWKLVEKGFGPPAMSPAIDEIIEFLPDGKVRIYINNDEYSESYIYRFNGTFLYWDIILRGEVVGSWTFSYTFYEDKFRLEVVEHSLSLPELYDFGFLIYKKEEL